MTATGDPREDRALAVLLLLPAAVLAWPWSPLTYDPFPHLAGAGWTALAALPLGAMLAIRRRARLPRAGYPLLLAIAVGVVAYLAGSATDTLEARRAGVHACVALVMLCGGAALRREGRSWLARGLLALSVAWTLVALLRRETELAGVLGNTGALSQAALPGAVVGALLLAVGPGAWRAAGALAFALFALHAARAPALTSILAAGGALVLVALLAPVARQKRFAPYVLVGLVALLSVAFFAPRAGPNEGDRDVTEQMAADTGGVGVRLGLWKRVPALLADHALLGVGPGQVQASFPPYRDPGEIRASSHGDCVDHATEIDHLHNDWLEGVAELGVVGGLGWLAFLLMASFASLVALRGRDLDRVALGAAAAGLLANALAHSPFLFHSASAVLGFALVGAISARETVTARHGWLGWALLVPVVLGAWLGRPLARHGAALSALARAGAEVERALEHAPDSVPALTLRARWLEDLGGRREEARATWLAVLERRPHDLAALQRLAFLAVTDGDPDSARAYWETALALDPEHPRVLRNLAHLELDVGDPAVADEHLATLERTGCLEPGWLRAVAVRLLFAGRGAEAFPLLARDDERYAEPTGGWIDALSKEAAQRGEKELAYGLESAAHHLWAREHVAARDWKAAVRSYRQALRPTHSKHAAGAPYLRFEMAAAQVRAGDRPGAVATLGALPAEHPERRLLPGWALDALGSEGL